MEAAGSSSSSKVIVQCIDPSNLFAVFEPRLSVRTPLKNLHWKSPNRPLRSIPSLNISITRDERLLDGPKQNIRRHQIPGLRETPYVKLYLLRCDDKDIYKERVRKEVRQWVKENTSGKDTKSSSRTQEQHDAAEWMIVHVVLPDTPAASQLKSSKHISVEAAESTDSVNSKSKWTGKSSSTIYDKLRADFSSGSKSQSVRVTQVRIAEPGRLTGALSVTEIEEQWQDFVENLKACILRSFDTRVTQYEDDIRERESQRRLPGWNFCTFFILKEGLARGFENVGLLDDALAVYEELEAGLDAVVKEHADQDDMESSGGLLPYSIELKNIIRNAIDPSLKPESDHSNRDQQSPTMELLLDSDKNKFPFDIEKRNYRDLILSNKVSALDFRVFMFTRKMEIQIRRAYGPAAPTGRSTSTLNSPTCNLDIMANLAETGVSFINLASRELRSDLYTAWGGRLSGDEHRNQRIVIGNIVAVWSWVAIMQVLSYTLPGLDADISSVATSHISTFDLQISEPEYLEDRNPRSSSRERHSNPSSTSTPRQLSRARSQQRELSSSRNEIDLRVNGINVATRPGSIRLSGWVARLLLLARNVLEELPASQSYVSGLRTDLNTMIRDKTNRRESSESPPEQSPVLEEAIDLTHELEDSVKSLDSQPLLRAVTSEKYFDELFYFLSKCARYFLVSGKSYRAAQQVMVETARVAYSRKDYDLATEYLNDLLNGSQLFYPPQVQPFLLEMYLTCLQYFEGTMEYCHCILKYLSVASQGPFVGSIQKYLDELTRISESVEPLAFPLMQILDVSSGSSWISHYSDRDGFFILLDLRTRFPGSLKISRNSQLTLCSIDGSEPLTIELHCDESLALGAQDTSCVFGSTCTTRGWYELEELKIQVGNICLSHNFAKHEKIGAKPVRDSDQDIVKIPRYFLYPRAGAISVKATSGMHVLVGKPQQITVVLNSGTNMIQKCSVRIRSATAGLRLQVHDSHFDTSNNVSIETSQEGEIPRLVFTKINDNSTAAVNIPYSVENSSEPTLIVKIEVLYETNIGSFSFYQTNSIDVILPISVNVQDFYRETSLMSRFTIGPATLGPIFLVDCQINGDMEDNINMGSTFARPVMIFPQQPASWIIKHHRSDAKTSQVNESLILRVRYQSLDDLILDAFETEFVNDLAKTPHAHLTRLLTPHLLYILKETWTEQDLELAGLTQEIEPWKYDENEWRLTLTAVKPGDRARLSEWISRWHEFHEPLRLISRDTRQRQLDLRVGTPPQPLTLTTDLRMNLYPNRSEYIALGQPIHATLVIQMVTNDKQMTDEKRLNPEVTYELVAPSDSWLLGGRKKGGINLDTLPMRIPITLVPQRVGYLLLPSIDIRARRRDEQDTHAVSGWVDLPIEAQNKTISKAIYVLANLSSTTIGMSFDDESGHGPGWVIDGQHWEPEQRISRDG